MVCQKMHRSQPGSSLIGTFCGEDWINRQEILDSFRKTIISWGKENFRPFPWRLTHDAYSILLAEVMLHRTQVTQVVPIFQNFIIRYPDVPSFTMAGLSELQSVLYPLGLNWRIELIYAMGQKISDQFHMQIPREKMELLSLPGVSEYIASAIRCFAWNISDPIIDTNTTRVIGRLFGLPVKDSSRRNSKFRFLITRLVDLDNPRDYNYALLDLAHLVCLKKKEPVCQECPLLKYCCYGQTKFKSVS